MTLAPAMTSTPSGATLGTSPTSTMLGIAVVRGGVVPVVQRRLPRRSPASLGSRDRNGLVVDLAWVPRDLGTFTAVDEGWLVHNTSRARMRVESDFVVGGAMVLLPSAIAMLQRGDHRIGWEGLERPLSVSVTVRTRRLEDQRIPFAVDSTVEAPVDTRAPAAGHYLGLADAPMSSALRYRLATLFRHLLAGEAEPRNLVQRASETLDMPEIELTDAAHRYRRRLNVVRGLDLQSIEELGEYLVEESHELTRDDLEP
jgi:hypothetical protein